jgi:uncharacterized protein
MIKNSMSIEPGRNIVANIFRDPVERRPRAFWRLLLQGLIFFLLLAVPQVASVIIAGIFIQFPAGVDAAEAQNILLNNPLLRIAIAISQIIAIWISFLIAARWLDRRPMRDFGFRFGPRWWRDLAFGLFLGAFLIAFVFVIQLAMGWVEITGYMQPGPTGHAFWIGILTAAILFLSVGIYEEMLFRGYHLRNLAEGLEGRLINPRAALLLAYFLSSAVFGVAHANNPNATLVSTINIAIAGLFLGLGFVLTGELGIPIGLHITWNFFMGNVFGFPVSGMQFGATVVEVNQLGPDLYTGGAFGPEAGLLGLGAMLLGSLLTVLFVRWNYGKARFRDELAVYPHGPVEESPLAQYQDLNPLE